MVQDKELPILKKKATWHKALIVVKVVVSALVLNYIFKTFQNEQKGIGDIGVVFVKVYSQHTALLSLMILLVPVNWALEALKWQTLTKRIANLGFIEALKGILTGLAVGVAVPAQLGDSIGRLAALNHERKLEAVGAALISNGIQFYVSTVAGTLGWWYLKDLLSLNQSAKTWITLSLIIVTAGGIVVGALRRKIALWDPKAPFLQKAQSSIKVIASYGSRELATATVWGTLRYAIFLTQFVLALSLFNFPIDILTLSACVSLIFLVKTVIPAVNVLGDLGLREFTALFVFRQFQLPSEEIIAATFMIWIINILGPIIIGLFLIWKYKWSYKNG